MKRNGIELSTGKILEEIFVQSTFQQTLGGEFKSTLELLAKTTLNVPVGSSYSFDLNRLENLWKDLKMAFKQ